MKSMTQTIKNYLFSGKSLTVLEASEKFSCLRLTAIVHTLRKKGIEVKIRFIYDVEKNKRIGEYYI